MPCHDLVTIDERVCDASVCRVSHSDAVVSAHVLSIALVLLELNHLLLCAGHCGLDVSKSL